MVGVHFVTLGFGSMRKYMKFLINVIVMCTLVISVVIFYIFLVLGYLSMMWNTR
jgi:hypothetical protein